MALTLDDLVRRRTDLGLGAHAQPALDEAAYLMSIELGWSADRTRQEVAGVSTSPPVAIYPVAEYARA